MSRKTSYVYIMGSAGGALYIGVTNDIERRVWQHKKKQVEGYSSRFSTNRLLYFEEFDHPADAIAAEKKLKGWLRKKKLDLIRTMNPKFRDLGEDWLGG